MAGNGGAQGFFLGDGGIYGSVKLEFTVDEKIKVFKRLEFFGNFAEDSNNLVAPTAAESGKREKGEAGGVA